MQRLIAVVLGVCVTLSAAVMAADYIPAGQPIPQNVRWINATPTGVDVRGSFSTTSGGAMTVTRRFGVGVSTLGRLAGGFLKRASPYALAYMTLKNLVEGAGWVIDELTKQVTTPGVDPVAPGATAWCFTNVNGRRCTDVGNQAGAIAACSSAFSPRYCEPYGTTGDGRPLLQVMNGNGTFFTYTSPSLTTMPTGGWQPSDYAYSGSDPVPISEAEIGELIKTNPEVVNAVLIDPETGAPIRFPEMIDAMNALRKEIELANGLTPGTDLTVDPDWGTTPTEVQGPQKLELPPWCEYAGIMCEQAEFITEEPPPDEPPPEVPFEETPIEMQSWSSGLGGGVCPAPVSLSVSLGGTTQNLEFEYEPICSFATTMRPLVASIALLLVPFIVGGFRSSKDA